MLTTPVAFIVFNRPDLTEQVFAAIRHAQPEKLYIIADGARNAEEQPLVRQTRAVAEAVDWPCTVTRIYSNQNLGCRKRVISGLKEVFANEEAAIILEDDCLPHPSFFGFCEAMLRQYSGQANIGTIHGTALPGVNEAGHAYLSKFSIVWGWATTRRVWQWVDPGVAEWGQLKKTDWLRKHFPGQKHLQYGVARMFDLMQAGYDAWSYALLFAILRHNLLNIYPPANLISNIGFDIRAAHTHQVKPYSNLPLADPAWQWQHGSPPIYHADNDVKIFETLYYWHLQKPTFFKKWKRKAWIYLYNLKQKWIPGISLKKTISPR